MEVINKYLRLFWIEYVIINIKFRKIKHKFINKFIKIRKYKTF